MTRTLITTRSQNAKTGRVALATYRTQDSCPVTCPMMGQGCYAENRGPNGAPSPFGFAGRGTIVGDDYAPLVAAIEKLKPKSTIRFNVSGDYLLDDGTPDLAYIEATNTARDHLVLSYTHAWRKLDPAWFEDGARPNASCDTLVDVVIARDAGWATVIVDPDGRFPQGHREEGQTFVLCPYETPSKRQCVDCGLCARGKRPSTVVFPTHGSRRRKASLAILEVIG